MNFNTPPPPVWMYSESSKHLISTYILSSVTSELWRLWWILEGLHLKEIGKVNITHQESPSLIHPHPLRPRNTRRHRFVIRGGAGQMGDRIAPSLHESWWSYAVVFAATRSTRILPKDTFIVMSFPVVNKTRTDCWSLIFIVKNASWDRSV